VPDPREGPPAGEFRQRLEETSPESLPPGVLDAARDACSGTLDIETAFLCWASAEVAGQPAERYLLLGLKISRPVEGPRDVELDLALSLLRRLPKPPGLRVAVLADRAVPAWRVKGVEVT